MNKHSLWKNSLIYTLLFISGITLGYSTYIYANPEYTFFDPLGKNQVQGVSTKSDFIVYGFLPYWLIKHSPDFQYQNLTHLAYFGIAIDETGQIQTNLPDNTKELGHHRLADPDVTNAVDQTIQNNGQAALVVRVMSTDAITAATEPNRQKALIQEIIDIAKEHRYTGINLDFEPTGNENTKLKENVTLFTKQMQQACKTQINNCHLSIDVYPSAGTKSRIWDLPKLAQYTDHIIIMAYDFHRPTSPQAGPNAPIHGAPDEWEYDINGTTNAILRQVPPEKIILAIPYYGYEWTTQNPQPGSTAIGRGWLATYSRIEELLIDCHEGIYTCQHGFDSQALTPYLIYQDGNQSQQIWYENNQSLSIKYKYIKSIPLAGVAIWALGYDAPSPVLWNLLEQEF